MRVVSAVILAFMLVACGRGGFIFGAGARDDDDRPDDPTGGDEDIVCTCDFPDTCDAQGVCGHEDWFALGSSVIGDTQSRLEWGSAGGAGIGGQDQSAIFDLSYDSDGTPIIAWASPAGLFVQYYDGASWHGKQNAKADLVSSGVFVTNGRGFDVPGRFVHDGSGRPVLLASGQWGTSTVSTPRAYTLTGAGWVQLGQDLPNGVGNPTGASDAAGNMIVAYTALNGSRFRIYVVRFNGSQWVEFSPGSASGDGVSRGPDGGTWDDSSEIALDASGRPCVSWLTRLSPNAYLRCWDGATWAEVGSSGTSPIAFAFYVSAPMVMLGPMDPLVLIAGADVGGYRYDGAAWSLVGGGFIPSKPIAQGTDCAWATTRGGPPVAVFTDNYGYELFATAYNGSGWSPIPASIDIAQTHGATMPRALEMSAGRYIIAWSDFSNGSSAVYTKAYDGTAWSAQQPAQQTALGGISAAGEKASLPAIAINDDATIDVLFAQGTSNVLRRFDQRDRTWTDVAGPWTALGEATVNGLLHTPDGRTSVFVSPNQSATLFTANDTGGWDGTPTVNRADHAIIAPNGERYVCHVAPNNQLEVLRYDGSAWVAVGSTLFATSSTTSRCALAFDGSRPLVAWVETPGGDPRLYVARYDGATWITLANAVYSDVYGTAIVPRMFYTNATGPVVAWTVRGRLHTERFDGTAWVTLGDVTNEDVRAFAVTVDAVNATPYIASASSSGGASDIHVYRYSGTQWDEIPSPLPNGISNSNTPSLQPAIAARDGLVCVAWVEQDGVTTRSVARCTQD